MSDTDEYEEFYTTLDIEDIPHIVSLPPSPEKSQPQQTASGFSPSNLSQPVCSNTQATSASSDDEFAEFDFSELTAEDYASIDAAVLAAFATGPTVHSQPAETTSTIGLSDRRGNEADAGGPAVPITVEESTDSSGTVKDSPLQYIPALSDSDDAFAWTKRGPSPYQRFRSFRGSLAVTDLVGPSWCEVQYDYGLRQKRTLKLEKRPSSFVTAEGKTITVDQSIAAVNDKIVKRGKTVHKVLEREIHPEEAAVEVTTPEERWGLRLVNMLASLQSLLQIGRCREMPVFGILHDQVVVGIIDEIERRPVSDEEASPPATPSRPVRGLNKRSLPNTPTKPKSKRSRRSRSPDQPSISTFFPASPTQRSKAKEDSVPGVHTMNAGPPSPKYKLFLSDTKTRRHESLPATEDTLPARLQLMFYHRLLSDLLMPPTHSEYGLDFQTLWTRVGVNHARTFSPSFRKQAGLMVDNQPVGTTSDGGLLASAKCLDDLTWIWRNSVEMLNLDGVDDTLTVVYRTQPAIKPKRRKCSSRQLSESTLLKQEEEDMIQAITASLREGSPLDDDQLSDAVARNWRKVAADVIADNIQELADFKGSSRSPNSGSTHPGEDVQMAWAIQQSLLEYARERPELRDAITPRSRSPSPSPSSHSGETTEPEDDSSDVDVEEQASSRIIGTKEFTMDSALLDRYLQSVLDWWHGRRAPRGVDVALTRRCLWCEYANECEWREKKAAEALAKMPILGNAFSVRPGIYIDEETPETAKDDEEYFLTGGKRHETLNSKRGFITSM
ncbi:hypothetical protein K474DRAFT_1698644 [Panus rudis PR-1116 ss-1]|nr:hypothetical protein K474DRAFT_1698644 [Panus rudis PR-1116 ss-1]